MLRWETKTLHTGHHIGVTSYNSSSCSSNVSGGATSTTTYY